MTFIADLHVHSKYSRATARDLDLEHLYIGARIKGITVVATGDFTHPAWIEEIREKLVPAEPGLFRLREDIRRRCEPRIPESCPGPVRFILETEISNIYKKNGKTRKNHNLIYVPSIEVAETLNTRLDAIGNINSDGRPILGLDARNLLEIMLECSEDAFLIPAHIWTPWFSLLGSRSGFDSLASCFEDLSERIFAVETGLSSDPPMNWRISELDSRTLVSNSDAHSPGNLGRNANIFNTELSFFSIRDALASGRPDQCSGTIDMYPEEGKYHMDGHRKCNLWRLPSEGAETGHLCPACGTPMTLGVLHRVEALADRPEGRRPEGKPTFHHLIPLSELLSEIFGVGAKSLTVGKHFQKAISRLGPELHILKDSPIEAIQRADIPLLGEAIHRMRHGKVHISPGFDGEYGRILVFGEGEKEALTGQQSIFSRKRPPGPAPRKKPSRTAPLPPPAATRALPYFEEPTGPDSPPPFSLEGLSEAQASGVRHRGTPLLMIAGPGTGKTRTLTHRIAYLLKARGVSPKNILAVTFTNKAAREMKERLKSLLASTPVSSREIPAIGTFHGFCLSVLREIEDEPHTIVDEHDRRLLVQAAVARHARTLPDGSVPVRRVSELISRAKQYILGPADDLSPLADTETVRALKTIYQTYQEMLRVDRLLDYDDLIVNTIRHLEATPRLLRQVVNRYRHVLVDEYQDVNPAQYRLIRTLCPGADKELFAIGDPDQSIYGFRGADVGYFQRFTKDYPGSRIIHLNRNYRSVGTIVDAAHQMIRRHSLNAPDIRSYSNIQGIKTLTIMEASSEKSEAVAVGRMIESMVGGFGFQSVDFGGANANAMEHDRAFSDVAVLYRSHAQGRVFTEVFQNAGIPCQTARREAVYEQPGLRELISVFRLISGKGTFNDFENACPLPEFRPDESFPGRFKTWFHDQDTPMKALLSRDQDHLSGVPLRCRERFDGVRDKLSELRGCLHRKSPGETLLEIQARTSLEGMIQAFPERVAALDSLIRKADETAADRGGDIFDTAALDTDADLHDGLAQKVTLMTFHASKGLEFPVVFIVGCEDGFLPFRNRQHCCDDVEEERRLFYVAMTRAMDRLFLSSTKTRVIHGKTENRVLSPFVRDIERRLITRHHAKARPSKNRGIQLDLFSVE